MKYLITAISLILAISTAYAQEAIREISWSEKRGALSVGEVIEANSTTPFAQLKVENQENKLRTFAVMSISDPGITASSYALTGKVRYEKVEGTGYLEMWSYFPDGGMVFSRALGSSGPMQSLQGSSDWRPFTLPFYIDETMDLRPTKLEFNIVLPGRGTVYLSPLELVQYGGKEQDIATTAEDKSISMPKQKAWWTARTANLIGGICGLIIGVFFGTIGTLAGFRKAKKMVFSSLFVIFIFGLFSFVFALTALVLSQPYAVYYGPLLLGILCPLLSAIFYWIFRKRYEEEELRKMEAMDIP